MLLLLLLFPPQQPWNVAPAPADPPGNSHEINNETEIAKPEAQNLNRKTRNAETILQKQRVFLCALIDVSWNGKADWTPMVPMHVFMCSCVPQRYAPDACVHVCRSEKPPMQYGQDLWRDFLRDFVLEVVGGPVVAAGNSIGGFISASLAADYPALVKGGWLV